VIPSRKGKTPLSMTKRPATDCSMTPAQDGVNSSSTRAMIKFLEIQGVLSKRVGAPLVRAALLSVRVCARPVLLLRSTVFLLRPRDRMFIGLGPSGRACCCWPRASGSGAIGLAVNALSASECWPHGDLSPPDHPIGSYQAPKLACSGLGALVGAFAGQMAASW